MNIQQFYQQSAAASLNASLAAFIPSIALLIYAIFISKTYHLLLLVIPFLIYSFFCYQKFLLYQKRAKTVKLSIPRVELSSKNLFDRELLLTFLPAPSLRLLFFTPTGMKAGEIRDQSFLLIRWFLPNFIDRLFTKKYGLYDFQDEPIVFYHDLKDRIIITSPVNQELAVIYKAKNGKNKEYFFETKSIVVKQSSLQDYSFHSSEGVLLANIQTGWMPLEWGERFVHTNTPILTIDEKLTDIEILQLFSLFISMYKYGNH
ncbi:hypothetical protein [Niallia oryzisoli]|uniref:hypothetical protein n=1 Tax=Niallia oryzisoli TaxID=1737571 RepID=UPI003734EB5B